ncbi:MAG: 16S rRNA (guanine(527)-N(7))-methyltransferase RsmG [Silicimonas sp.]|nr:16S rRNA (guanine(527)-N(7))-methyltransferase RsmG [Silicimonas sp.]
MDSLESAFEGRDVSRETISRLSEFVALVKKWNPKINLVSKGSMDDIWTRHILDSAQILEYAPPGIDRWMDLGSGGGFPGVVIATMLNEIQPETVVTLVEADQRKATFLKTVARELGVTMEIRAQRIESLAPQGADVVSARALAPLPKLLEYVSANLRPGGCALLLKGENAGNEVKAALEAWRFACETYPSKTNNGAVILKIGDIERA